MSDTMLSIILVIGLALFIFVVRFVLYKIFDKGADALTNTYKQKKNFEKKDDTENLSDRYR